MKHRWLAALAAMLCLALLAPMALAEDPKAAEPRETAIETVAPEEDAALEAEEEEAPAEDREADAEEIEAPAEEGEAEPAEEEVPLEEEAEPVELAEAEDAALEAAYAPEELEAIAEEEAEPVETPQVAEASDGTYEYETTAGGVNITAYLGDLYSNSLTIPSTVGGKTVVGITGQNRPGGYVGAFESVRDLNYVTLPGTLKTIGKQAFKETELKSVTIPASVENIGDSAFEQCANLESVTFGSGSKLKTIGAKAFMVCEKLTAITFPNSLTSIGLSAFDSCSKLANVNFGSGLKTLEFGAFRATRIQTLNLPAGVEQIGNNAFQQIQALTTVVIQSGSIGKMAFHTCHNLTSLTLGSGVTSIGEEAFRLCSSLPAVNIPGNVKTIGMEAFIGCEKLTAVTLNEGIIEIGSRAFGGNPNSEYQSEHVGAPIQSIVVPASAQKIDESIFAYCEELTSATVKSPLVSGEMFFHCSKLANLNLSAVKTLSQESFHYCAALKSVTVPGAVTTVPSGCFQCCASLEKVTLESGVK